MKLYWGWRQSSGNFLVTKSFQMKWLLFVFLLKNVSEILRVTFCFSPGSLGWLIWCTIDRKLAGSAELEVTSPHLILFLYLSIRMLPFLETHRLYQRPKENTMKLWIMSSPGPYGGAIWSAGGLMPEGITLNLIKETDNRTGFTSLFSALDHGWRGCQELSHCFPSSPFCFLELFWSTAHSRWIFLCVKSPPAHVCVFSFSPFE